MKFTHGTGNQYNSGQGEYDRVINDKCRAKNNQLDLLPTAYLLCRVIHKTNKDKLVDKIAYYSSIGCFRPSNA